MVPKQELPIQVKVDLGVMAMKGIPHSPKIQFCVILRIPTAEITKVDIEIMI